MPTPNILLVGTIVIAWFSFGGMIWYFTFASRFHLELDKNALHVCYTPFRSFSSAFSLRNQLFVRTRFLLESAREVSLSDIQVGHNVGTMPIGNAYAGGYESELDGKKGIAWIYARKSCERALAVPLRGGEILVLGVSDPKAFLAILRSPSAEFSHMKLARR